MQGQTRTAADEWEASSRPAILESGTEPESAREGPHPLRTADWKLEVSLVTHSDDVARSSLRRWFGNMHTAAPRFALFRFRKK